MALKLLCYPYGSNQKIASTSIFDIGFVSVDFLKTTLVKYLCYLFLALPHKLLLIIRKTESCYLW